MNNINKQMINKNTNRNTEVSDWYFWGYITYLVILRYNQRHEKVIQESTGLSHRFY